MDPELKSALGLLIDKVEKIDGTLSTVQGTLSTVQGTLATVDGRLSVVENRLTSLEGKFTSLDGRFTSLEEKVTALDGKVERIEATLPTLATKADVGRLEEEQRQMKEMLGMVRLKEIGRLDGRIDQLTMQFDLLRKPDAA